MKKGGNVKLLEQQRVILEEDKKPGAYSEAKLPNLKKVADYYYLKFDKKPEVLIKRRKDLYKVFPKNQKNDHFH